MRVLDNVPPGRSSRQNYKWISQPKKEEDSLSKKKKERRRLNYIWINTQLTQIFHQRVGWNQDILLLGT
jgi:hypothetical protein